MKKDSYCIPPRDFFFFLLWDRHKDPQKVTMKWNPELSTLLLWSLMFSKNVVLWVISTAGMRIFHVRT